MKRLDETAAGVYLIAVTPFTDCGALDLASTDRMVDFCLEQGVTVPLARYEQQPGLGLAVRKHILAQRGVIASAAVRKPGPQLSSADIAVLTARQTRRLRQIS